jgi:hypothetical protein
MVLERAVCYAARPPFWLIPTKALGLIVDLNARELHTRGML